MASPWIALDQVPTFPPGCACCQEETAGSLEVASRLRAADAMLRPVDRIWLVPYCDACAAHVREAWRRTARLKRRWLIATVCLFAPGLVLHALLIAMIPVFLAGTGIVFAISRAREGRVPVGERCAAPTAAVQRRGPDRGRYHVRFLHPAYAARFAAVASPAAAGQRPGS